MLLEKVLRREHDSIWAVARVADQQQPRLDAGSLGEEWLRRAKGLLNVLRIGHKIRHTIGRGNLTDAIQFIALHQIFKPCRSGLDGDGVSVEIRKRMNG